MQRPVAHAVWALIQGQGAFAMPAPKKPIPKKPYGYQFKITLADSQPSIWRRIIVPDGTLDDLHEWIQAAMGWTNSHLHQFEIRRKLYGDPMMLEADLYDIPLIDTRETTLADLFDKARPPKKFSYEYDFGDGWQHEIEFEGIKPAPAGKKPPCCLEGQRSCPPEDVGGVWGYADFLTAIREPEHEEHEHYLEWVGGDFDPEEFSLAEATKAMRTGLPSWHD